MVLVLTILRFAISAWNVTFNAFLIHALRKRDKLKIVSYWLISCLSITDVFVGILGLVEEGLIARLGSHCAANDVCFLTRALVLFSVNFSLIFLLIIATDRFIHLKYSLRYKAKMTKKRAVALVCFNVIFTLHMVITAVLLPKYQPKFIELHALAYRIYRVILSSAYVLILVAVYVLYTATYLALRKISPNTANLPTTGNYGAELTTYAESRPSASTIYNGRRRSPDQEFVFGVGLILFSSFVCLIPNVLVAAYNTYGVLIQNGKYTPSESAETVRKWTFLAVQLNSSLNAIIILICSRELRKYTKQCFSRSVTREQTIPLS